MTLEAHDEGLVDPIIPVQQYDRDGEPHLLVGEELFGWDSWSLAAPRPGPKVVAEEAGGPTVATVEPGPAPGYPLTMQNKVEPGTLPRLRYGRSYSFRARAVDLAGNSIDPALCDPAYVTSPAIYHRHEPVAVPVLVPRRRFVAGESLLRLVALSDGDGNVLGGPSERHIASAKASQHLAETHGLFDEAIGPDNASRAAARQRQLDIARREAGSFLDPRVPNPNGSGDFLLAKGIAVTTNDPVKRPPVSQLPLPRGLGLRAGEYVIHDIPGVICPYLPDPAAAGAAFTGLPGGGVVTVDYGTRPWPNAQPFRLALSATTSGSGGASVVPEGGMKVLHVTLPPAAVITALLSSTITPAGLAVMDEIDPQQRQAALDGQVPIFSPRQELIMVHAVRRPLAPVQPTFTRFREYFLGVPDDDPSMVRESSAQTIHVLNARRPDPVAVHSLVPIFTWDRRVQAGRYFSVRKTSGVRVYLQRPWHTTGADERLGVLVYDSPAAGEAALGRHDPVCRLVSHWGLDPLEDDADLGVPQLSSENFPARKEVIKTMTLLEMGRTREPSTYGTAVVGHEVQFDAERGLWYADVEITLPIQRFPFLRLGLVRFQPMSAIGNHVSRVEVPDPVQLPPTRTLSAVLGGKAGEQLSITLSGSRLRQTTYTAEHHQRALDRTQEPRLDITEPSSPRRSPLNDVSPANPHEFTAAGALIAPLPESPAPPVIPPEYAKGRIVVREHQRGRDILRGELRSRVVYFETFDRDLPPNPTLSASPETVIAGGQVTVTWAGATGSTPKDWIGRFTPRDPNQRHQTYQYTDGTAAGTRVFTMDVPPGMYVFHFLPPDGYVHTATSNVVTVTSPPTTPTGNQRATRTGQIAGRGAQGQTLVTPGELWSYDRRARRDGRSAPRLRADAHLQARPLHPPRPAQPPRSVADGLGAHHRRRRLSRRHPGGAPPLPPGRTNPLRAPGRELRGRRRPQPGHRPRPRALHRLPRFRRRLLP